LPSLAPGPAASVPDEGNPQATGATGRSSSRLILRLGQQRRIVSTPVRIIQQQNCSRVPETGCPAHALARGGAQEQGGALELNPPATPAPSTDSAAALSRFRGCSITFSPATMNRCRLHLSRFLQEWMVPKMAVPVARRKSLIRLQNWRRARGSSPEWAYARKSTPDRGSTAGTEGHPLLPPPGSPARDICSWPLEAQLQFTQSNGVCAGGRECHRPPARTPWFLSRSRGSS